MLFVASTFLPYTEMLRLLQKCGVKSNFPLCHNASASYIEFSPFYRSFICFAVQCYCVFKFYEIKIVLRGPLQQRLRVSFSSIFQLYFEQARLEINRKLQDVNMQLEEQVSYTVLL